MHFGRSWGLLGGFKAILEALGHTLGALGAFLGALGAVLEAS